MPTVSGFASTNAVVTTGWTNPTNAYADDATYATATIVAKNTVVSSRYGGFGVAGSLPGGATINSVTVNAEMKVSTTSSIARLGVQAQSPSGTNRGTQTLDTSEPLTDTVITQTVTFATFGWTAADLADGTLFAVVEANQGNNATSCTYSLDYVQVVVDYTVSNPVLALDLDTDALTGLVDTDPIATFTDQSAQSNSVTQATGTAQAAYRTAQSPTGKAVARFDGGDFYTKGSAPTNMATQEFTWFAVVNSSAFGDNRIIMVAGAATGGREWRLFADGTQGLIKCNTADLLAGTATRTTGTWYIVAVRYKTDGTINLYKTDGTSDGSTTSVANFTDASADLWVGEHTGGGGKWTGDIAEVKAYNYARTDLEVTNEIAALDAKWLTAAAGNAPAGLASGTGAAPDATVQVSGAVTVNAGLAAGTGSAPDAAVQLPGVVSGATPSVLGAQILGLSPIGAVPTAAVVPGQVSAAAATGSGVAAAPTVAVAVNAGVAAGAGGAPDPTPAVAVNAEAAAGTGSAPTAAAAVAANAGIAGAIASTGLVETFEVFTNGETWADSTTHGQWVVQFGGNTGPGVGIETDGSLVLYEKPTAPTDPDPGDETHSSLVASTQTFGDIDYRVRVKTVQQLRQNLAPNDWEVAWLVWHYTDNAHFYYVALKSNGVELGKRHPAYAGGQRFLDTPATPTLTIGAWNDFRVTQTGNVITVFIDGTQVSTFTDTGGVQGDAAYTSGQVGLYNEDAWVRFDNVSVNQSVPAVGANAGAGAGSGAALDATVSTITAGTAPADVATGAGTAADPTVAITVNADAAAGTGAAQDATAAAGPLAGPAAGAGAALAAQASITANAEAGVGAAAAPDATVSTLAVANAPAEVATGSASAPDPTVAAVVNAPAEAAAATGAAPDATVSTLALTNANTELAAGTGTASDPTAAAGTNAGAAAGTGAAFDATVATGINAAAELAAGTGAAPDAAVAIAVPAGVGTGTGLAPDPVGQASRDAPAGLAAAAGSALDASVAIRANAEVATGTGLAPDPFAYIPPPVPPPRWVEGDTTGTGLTEGDTGGSGQVEGVLVGAGIVEGSSSV